MSPALRILVVEDDMALGQLMADYLELGGFSVIRATTAGQASEYLSRQPPTLVLLDLSLPDEDGLVLLRRLRQISDVPIIIVSGRADSESRVVGLEMGADDFIVKPFSGRELLARVQNILRRVQRVAAPRDMEIDGLVLRTGDHFVIGRSGERIGLTQAEASVLGALARANGRTLDRDQLIDARGNSEMAESTRGIDIVISRLRAKLERDRKRPSLILTVQGIGYRLNI